MVTSDDLVRYCDEFLRVAEFRDYSPNGLQVRGRDKVQLIVSGVTASLRLVERAAELGGDALLVHHGWFWRGEDPRVIGIRHARLKVVLAAELNLIAYHLPLDAHPGVGNNIGLARAMEIAPRGRFGPAAEGEPGWWGEFPKALPIETLVRRLEGALDRSPLRVGDGPDLVRRVGWCSGGAQDLIEDAGALGLDTYVSGEISERTVHIARELGLHYLAAGHHATERFGVCAMGDHLAKRFDLEHRYIDLNNPV